VFSPFHKKQTMNFLSENKTHGKIWLGGGVCGGGGGGLRWINTNIHMMSICIISLTSV